MIAPSLLESFVVFPAAYLVLCFSLLVHLFLSPSLFINFIIPIVSFSYSASKTFPACYRLTLSLASYQTLFPYYIELGVLPLVDVRSQ
ncbi:hypothetical protein BDW69DRAFT_173575 [Aspergillus filifer]